ncbi:MerR family transcriptional regulator [Oribacterium sp. P9]|uniref:MerR family transcriptional regulator n=1 Tax=Oribacterium sp. P9 TaxID=3378068 RepID=UPI0039677C91
MKAKEIEEMYGISSQKIKDYKKAGVFSSASATSNGKAIDYSAEDVETLVKINVLGKAGLTIKDIGEVQNGECNVDGSAEFLRQNSKDEIKARILSLYKDKDKYKKMAEAAWNRARYEFSYKEIAKRAIGLDR